MNNFMIHDILGVILAVFGFATILLAPGYVLGMATDLFSFRQRSLSERCAWAVALSFATAPILTILAGRIVPLTAVAAFFAILAAVMLVLLVRDRRSVTLPITR